MTDVSETASTDTKAPPAPSTVRDWPALLVAIVALLVALFILAAPHVPQLQRFVVTPQPTPQANDTAVFNAMRQRIEELASRPAAEKTVDLTPLLTRLDALEQRANSAEAALNEERKKSHATTSSAGLAFVRVENRLLRGEAFIAELQLLKQLIPNGLTPEQERDLAAAATGTATATALVDQLQKQERHVRRAERVDVADNPLGRAWAELRSMVLVRDAAKKDSTQDDAFNAFLAAVQQGNSAATEAAWQNLSHSTKQLLADIYREVERRQRAEKSLIELAPVALAVN